MTSRDVQKAIDVMIAARNHNIIEAGKGLPPPPAGFFSKNEEDISALTRVRDRLMASEIILSGGTQMTDISTIADAIVALINSKMRSPTKDEIQEVLAKHLPQQGIPDPNPLVGWYGIVNNASAGNSTLPPADCGNPIFSIFPKPDDDHYMVTWSAQNDPTGFSPVYFNEPITHEEFEAAVDAICRAEGELAYSNTDGCLLPLPYEPPSVAYQKLLAFSEECKRDLIMHEVPSIRPGACVHEWTYSDNCNHCGISHYELIKAGPKI